MELDKELYRQMYQAIGELKEQEYIERVLEARRMTPQQAWDQFSILFQFGLKIALDNREYQHRDHLKSIEEYYRRLITFEARRTPGGGTAKAST